MKQVFTVILAASLALSLVACGGSDAPAEPAPTASSASSAAASTSELQNAEFTPEQQAAAQKFLDLGTRYDAVADKVNADPNLAQLQEIVDAMNSVSSAITEADAVFADPANLTADTLAQLDTAVAETNLFLDEVEAMLTNYGGKTTVTVPVTIVNDTDADFYALSMSPANDDSWGGNLLTEPLAVGESGVSQMTFTEDTLIWDLQASDSQGNTISFAGLDFSTISTEGATLRLALMDGIENNMYVAGFVLEE